MLYQFKHKILNTELFEKTYLDEESVIYFSDKIKEFMFSSSEFDEIWNIHPKEFHNVKMYGKEVLTPRWQQAYGKNYNYSGSKNNALPIPQILLFFLSWSQKNIDHRLNGLLLNWYDGKKDHYIGAHRDDTRDLLINSPIVTISLGEERLFRLRPFKGKGFKDISIKNGEVIVIPWNTNLKWTHEVPSFKKYTKKRISITLRAYKQ